MPKPINYGIKAGFPSQSELQKARDILEGKAVGFGGTNLKGSIEIVHNSWEVLSAVNLLLSGSPRFTRDERDHALSIVTESNVLKFVRDESEADSRTVA